MPFDNIKTRIQSAKCEYDGMIDCAIKVARSEGLRAFWGGTTPRLMRLMVSSFAPRFFLHLTDYIAALKWYNIYGLRTGRSILEFWSTE